MILATKTMVLQFMLEGPRSLAILCFIVCTKVEYLNRNVSIDHAVAPTLLKIYCGLCTVKAKNANKNIKQTRLSGLITIAFY